MNNRTEDIVGYFNESCLGPNHDAEQVNGAVKKKEEIENVILVFFFHNLE